MKELADELTLVRAKAMVRDRLPRVSGAASLARARRFLVDGVLETTEFGAVEDLDSGWADVAQRSRGRHLHGFLFLGDLDNHLRHHPGDSSAQQAVLSLLREWERSYSLGHTKHPMAYHDETTAQRLLYVLATLPHLESLPHEQLSWSHGLLDETAALLESDEFHAGLNNHGMFQDLALLAYAVLADWRDTAERVGQFSKAHVRLMTYFRSSFTSEGVHIENAPNYHVLVARHVKEHRDLLEAAGMADADELRRLFAGAASYATHVVKPTGAYPLISDTKPSNLVSVARNIFSDDHFLFAASAGAEGRMPRERVVTFPDSGYAIYRSAWGDPQATFVLFHAAYNSGYHKHSDDNSLWVYSGGRDLLAEAGPNGYEYKDPLTKYAYSQFAHNTMVVGDRSTPRHDGRMGDVSMTVHEQWDGGFRATGTNKRLAHAVHERSVTVAEQGGPHLEVTDRLEAEQVTEGQILWNVGPGLEVELGDSCFVLRDEDGNARLALAFTSDVEVSLSVHSGETKPGPLGWRFPRFGEPQPSPVVRLRFAAQTATIRSTITIGQDVALADSAVGDETSGPLTVRLAKGSGGTSLGAQMNVPYAETFAFKLYRGAEVVSEIRYSPEPVARWSDLVPGRYRVRAYARIPSTGDVVATTSESVFV